MLVIDREREIRDREMEAGPPHEGRIRERGNRLNLRKLRPGVTTLRRPPLADKVAAPQRQIRAITAGSRRGTFSNRVTFRTYIEALGSKDFFVGSSIQNGILREGWRSSLVSPQVFGPAQKYVYFAKEEGRTAIGFLFTALR